MKRRIKELTAKLQQVDLAFGSPADQSFNTDERDFELAVAADGLTATVAGGLHRSGIPTAALLCGIAEAERLLAQLKSTPEFAGRQDAAADLCANSRTWL